MKRFSHLFSIVAMVCVAGAAQAQESYNIPYQGRLTLNGEAYTGTADFLFVIYDEEGAANSIGGSIRRDVVVENGLFETDLYYPLQSLDERRWVEVQVRTPAWDNQGPNPPFTTLEGRTRLNPAPYASRTRGIEASYDGQRVGIGTPEPIAPLHITRPEGVLVGEHVSQGGYTALQLKVSQAMGGFGQIQAVRSAGSEWGNLVLNQSGGNVGVGTTDPQAKLHVQGGAIVTGTLRAAGGVEWPSGGRMTDVAMGSLVATTPALAPGQFVDVPIAVPIARTGDFVLASLKPHPAGYEVVNARVVTPGVAIVGIRNNSGSTLSGRNVSVTALVIER